MSINQFLEIEYKYNAQDITLSRFKAFCLERAPKKYLEVSGYDYFYSPTKDTGFFGRYRVGPDAKMLTVKRKTNDANNFIRGEINLQVSEDTEKDKIDAFFEFFEYTPSSSLFKSCFIYNYDYYTFVYYIVYNNDMKEIGRFIEIEMSEDHNWGAGEAQNYLITLEKLCKPLGIFPQARVKRSLFEMFGTLK